MTVQSQERMVVTLANLADVDNLDYYNSLNTYLQSINVTYDIIVSGDLPGSEEPEGFNAMIKTLKESKAEKVVIIPGDRDWDNSGRYGWDEVLDLEKRVEDSGKKSNIKWPLNKACPGPETIKLGNELELIVINTQWFNHPFSKPRQEDGICKFATQGDFIEELEDLIDENAGMNLIIAGHYPIASLGEYGGFIPMSKWIFPVPLVSGMVSSYKQNVGDPKDLVNPRYNGIRTELGQLLSEHNSLIYLSGHEKNLQVLDWDQNFLVNSGSPEEAQFAAHTKMAKYSESQPGFIILHYFPSGRVDAEIIKYTGDYGFSIGQKVALMSSSCEDKGMIQQNKSFVPCERQVEKSGGASSSETGSSQQVVAGPEYAAGGFKRMMMGAHYRDSWTQDVKVNYLDLDHMYQGLTPFARGGGRQTKSLKFKAGNGYEYVFRSVNKDPTKALPVEFRGTILETIIRDQTTTQQPYGALAADILLNKLQILHAHPKLFLLPNDSRLGGFQEDYGNMIGMIEERPTNPDSKDEKTFADAKKIRKSFKMFKDLYDDKDNYVDQQEFIRARTFDILVGDWGKHEDNWKWAGFKSDTLDGLIYRPIPRDRDHVFSRWDGALPWLADREWAKPSGENFGYKIKGLRSLMWQARHLDRFVANEMTRQDWMEQAKVIQDKISTETIENAVRNMPPEVYESSGREIENKLKRRIQDLPGYAEQYYYMLAKEVDIVGSAKKEYFELERNTDGSLKVDVYNVTQGDKKGHKRFYQRVFYANETNEVRLYGLGGDDIFSIKGSGRKLPVIRLIGGYGDDTYSDMDQGGKSGGKQMIYDNVGDNHFEVGRGSKIKKHADPIAYRYDRTAFAYNTYFPLIFMNYSSDLGFAFGLNTTFTNQKFGKPLFSSMHIINLEATTEGNLIADYSARLHHTFGNWDLLFDMHIGYPNQFNYFYGLGNESVKDQGLYLDNFYRTRYNSYSGGFGFLNEFWTRSKFQVNFSTVFNSGQLETNNIFTSGSENFLGAKAQDIFRTQAILDLDFRDKPDLSTRGMRYYLEHETGWVLNQDNKRYHKFESSLEQFLSTRNRNPLTIGIKVGGSYTSGDIPYYLMYYLGQHKNLRGYRMNRFTGDTSLFLNTDLRWKVGEFRTTILPIGYGLRGFFDTGRVFMDGENSNQWHPGYGFGFYFIPLLENFSINLSLGFSEEESGLLLFSFGKTFN